MPRTRKGKGEKKRSGKSDGRVRSFTRTDGKMGGEKKKKEGKAALLFVGIPSALRGGPFRKGGESLHRAGWVGQGRPGIGGPRYSQKEGKKKEPKAVPFRSSRDEAARPPLSSELKRKGKKKGGGRPGARNYSS